MKTLRDYQQKGVDAVFSYFENRKGNPVIVAPVGAGKSLMIAETIKQCHARYGHTKIMVLSHVAELLTQNAQELREQWQDAQIGFYSASLNKKQIGASTTFASIQSIYNKAFEISVPDLIIVDECHLISPSQNTSYQYFFSELKKRNPYLKIIGFTGTPYRQGQGYITEGRTAIFDDIAFEIEMLYLIEQGYLSPVKAPDKPLKTRLSAEGVKISGGDYQIGALSNAVNTKPLNESCVDEIIEHGKDRNQWLVFTVSIEHCQAVTDIFKERGVSVAMVTGKTPKAERDKIVNDYKAGRIKCLVNVAVFTTGFNNPGIDLIAFMRPTRSPVLYVQCVGRGMRTAPHKEDCLLLDFGGVVESLGAVDKVKIKRPKSKDGDAPIKTCPKCHTVVYSAVRSCPDCGYEFEFDTEVKIEKQSAVGVAVLSNQNTEKDIDIIDVKYRRHSKEGSEYDTFKVTYLSLGHKPVYEFLGFDHPEGSYPRSRATRWAIDRGVTGVKNIDHALSIDWQKPQSITVVKNGKYFNVKKCNFVIDNDVKQG